MLLENVDFTKIAESLLEAEDAAFYILAGPKWRYAFVNRGWVKAVKENMGVELTPDMVAGKEISEINAKANMFIYSHIIQSVINDKKPVYLKNVCIIDEKKQETYWHLFYWPVLDNRNRVVNIVGKAVDVSEDNIKKKDDFFAVAAHELRTPLTVLQLYLNLIKDNKLPIERWSNAIELAYKQSEHLARIIQDFMGVSKINPVYEILKITNFNITAKLREMVATFQDIAQQTITFTCLAGDVYINGDESRLEQVFFNIIENAVKYSPSDSTVKIVLAKEGEFVNISIEDEGIGIPGEELPFVFERFYRAKNGSSISGMGIGLFVSREIIQRHGGHIEVKSNLGKGTCFIVKLPVDVKGSSEATAI